MIKGKEGGVSYVSISLVVMLISIPLYVVDLAYITTEQMQEAPPPKTSFELCTSPKT